MLYKFINTIFTNNQNRHTWTQ